ncbi:hypothetical protein V498_02929 [Pseudogymnoascus sp. VKM F-4517 (FW-2822)]|nr:hypothetical protein V498_02929 [Pseudogymnoascus sp. VKM F-4517 (FW-2822)]
MSFLYAPKEGFAPSPEQFRAVSPICARVDRYKLQQNFDVGDMGVLANEVALRTGDYLGCAMALYPLYGSSATRAEIGAQLDNLRRIGTHPPVKAGGKAIGP